MDWKLFWTVVAGFTGVATIVTWAIQRSEERAPPAAAQAALAAPREPWVELGAPQVLEGGRSYRWVTVRSPLGEEFDALCVAWTGPDGAESIGCPPLLVR